ncbi:MAG: hypothetical protein HGJ93_08155 [Desulfosarcina sp.]|nr:hypothetical protein [Desulfosarcina sp.]MBC2765915.1 hypothetical protein [Desulfosarcina sp.]
MADDPNGSIKKAHAKTNLYFWPCDGDVTQASRWQESNCTLARLLANHRRVLGKAISVAVEIRRGIDDLVPSMAALCHRTCRFCPEPCCISNTVWFDLRDLLLFHLLKDPIPVGQAVSEPGVPCPFLSHNGCRLPPRIRPWMCFQYICPTQHSNIAIIFSCIFRVTVILSWPFFSRCPSNFSASTGKCRLGMGIMMHR